MTAEINIQYLTTSIMEGSELSFNTFYDMYYDRLYRYIFVMTDYNEEQTRGVIQDVMMRVVKYIKPIDTEEQLWYWLIRISRTAFIDDCRKKKKTVVETEFDPALHSQVEEKCSELGSAVNEAMEKLDTKEYSMIQNFYFENGSYKSLALELDSTPKAIESKLARIRNKLKQIVMEIVRG